LQEKRKKAKEIEKITEKAQKEIEKIAEKT
jgi:hypothetical protein